MLAPASTREKSESVGEAFPALVLKTEVNDENLADGSDGLTWGYEIQGRVRIPIAFESRALPELHLSSQAMPPNPAIIDDLSKWV
jgi:hypothetical protein